MAMGGSVGAAGAGVGAEAGYSNYDPEAAAAGGIMGAFMGAAYGILIGTL